MKKQDVIDLFGGTVKGLADAMGITSQAISQWPDDLGPNQIKRITHIVNMLVAGGDKAIGRRFKKLLD